MVTSKISSITTDDFVIIRGSDVAQLMITPKKAPINVKSHAPVLDSSDRYSSYKYTKLEGTISTASFSRDGKRIGAVNVLRSGI